MKHSILLIAGLWLGGCAQLEQVSPVDLGDAPAAKPVSSKERLVQRATIQTRLSTLQAQKLSLEKELDSDPLRKPTAALHSGRVSINDLLIRTEIHDLDSKIQHLEAQLSSPVE